MRTATLLVLVASVQLCSAQTPYKPDPQELLENYRRAEELERRARTAVLRGQLAPQWLSGGAAFWYRSPEQGGKQKFWMVTAETGHKAPAFDHARLADALSKALAKPVAADALPFGEIGFSPDLKTLRIEVERKRWDVDLANYALKEGSGLVDPARQGQGGPRRGTNRPRSQDQAIPSPDGRWKAEIVEGKLRISGPGGPSEPYESKIENVAAVRWSPDSKRLVAFKLFPGDRKQVHLIRSSGEGTRGQLLSRLYDQPGDKLDTFQAFIVDPSGRTEAPSELPIIWTGGQPWAGAPGITWLPGGKEFLVDYAERGYGRYFVDAISVETGSRRTVVDEDPSTFFDTTAMILRPLAKSPELIWRSERDGFGRLYLVDGATGQAKNAVTPPGWVVRGVEWLDEDARKLCFTANLVDANLDPYFIHYFTVGFDGKGLVRLTEGHGTHRVTFSPDRKAFVDTWSRVDQAPTHELRRTSDGKRLALLGTADVTEWNKLGLRMPEPFVAKGRDGKTDIWGVIVRPSHFDPAKTYPVIENIYAGPQDSFTPKAFSAFMGMQKLAELGFIVVQMDGMGTRNRGKAFHDVCYKNLADAGFPDRILWMKALAAKYPQADISRVGVYGTSAGGQSAAGAVLFHPEFYRVAVSACGCHDNRIDKFWWNEQWMGPMGPHYAEQSNITNAPKLRGHMMLIVGELDSNVPPESTYQLADALIRARKDFELVVIPGANHTSGGPHGDRKRMDFFVRHLLGVPTPDWNRG
jgi:dipeptidyl aminopeptidase/acylaminoacyl peptidase